MIDHLITASLFAALGGLAVAVTLAVVFFRRTWAVNPYRLGPNILAAEPRIRHIIEHVADPDMPEHSLHHIVSLNLTGIDHTAAVIRMAAVMLEIGRRAGMPADEVAEFFPPWDELTIEDES